MKINNNENLKKFAKELSVAMGDIGEVNLASEIMDWYRDFFTTSTEFLGEFKFILERILVLKNLSKPIKSDVAECIKIISKSLGI